MRSVFSHVLNQTSFFYPSFPFIELNVLQKSQTFHPYFLPDIYYSNTITVLSIRDLKLTSTVNCTLPLHIMFQTTGFTTHFVTLDLGRHDFDTTVMHMTSKVITALVTSLRQSFLYLSRLGRRYIR